MSQIFSDYEDVLNTIQALFRARGADTRSPKFDTLSVRLRENMEDARLFGDTPTLKSDRASILHELNRLSEDVFQKKFLEHMDSKDNGGDQDAIETCDLLVFVALSEEFPIVLDRFGAAFQRKEIERTALTIFQGIVTTGNGFERKVVLVPAGKMGPTRAASVTASIFGHIAPKNVAVVGIAGTLSDDIQPGDVFIPDSVREYLANTAAVGTKTLEFKPSGNDFPSDPRLLNRLSLFQINEPDAYRQWEKEGLASAHEICPIECRKRLARCGIQAPNFPRLCAGDDRVLGSGPAVAKGGAFLEWLKAAKRKIAAIEMESAGVYDSTFIQTPTPRVIAIRGISDYADERKNDFETATNGLFRKVATRNAASLLAHAINRDLFRD
jgi:nucleoside phosphorylase